MHARPQAENFVDLALDALNGTGSHPSVLDQLPVPVYVTDAEGAVTYWNRACVEFAGREPELGKDRWCVTWQLYTMTGEPLPHDQCPMAEAIRQRRPIREAVAIAERPDGTRRAFTPYPTPLFAADGTLRGAVNVLIDVTDEQNEALAEQAGRCRRLADAMYDRHTSTVLGEMARRYERTAADLRKTAGSD